MRIGTNLSSLANLAAVNQRASELSLTHLASGRAANSVAQTSTKAGVLDPLREHLFAIRDLARSERLAHAFDRAASQRGIDTALGTLSNLAGVVFTLGGTENATSTSGQTTASGSANVRVRALSPGAALAVTGQVERKAEAASLTIGGNSAARAAVSGSFVVAGRRGQQRVAITAGEKLKAVADRINTASHRTGVRAARLGDDLVLTSTERGSRATVAVHSVDVTSSPTVSAQNTQQVQALTVNALNTRSDHVLAGQLISNSSGAELRYVGNSGATVVNTATFTLTGSDGSTAIGITAEESLNDVAQRVNDVTGTTGVAATVVGDELVLQSSTTGAAAQVEIELTTVEQVQAVSGVNGSQVTSFQIDSLTDNSLRDIEADVLTTATAAALTIHGTTGSVASQTVTFTLTGDDGSASISITAGEALGTVADRINDETATTGVTATVNGNDVELTSSNLGSAAGVEITVTAIEDDVAVTGVNGSQLSDFQVVSIAENSQQTLDGTIDQVASQAELTYTGTILNQVSSSATFTLTGSSGSAVISVTALEQLTAVADRINAETGGTGVTASVAGNVLTLNSTGVGSNAAIEVDVTSGTFNVSGGNGDGTAAGGDATATINGQALTAVGNDFTYAAGGDTFTFTTVQGFTGTIDTVTVTSADQAFNQSGGNGDGTADGTDATATIEGQSLTGTGNTFTVVDGGDQFTLTFAAGFTGAIDTITVTSTAGDFTVTGGDGNGLSLGTDASAEVNGQLLAGAGNTFTLSDAAGSFTLQFAEGFSGEFDPITITPAGNSFEVTGGDGRGRAIGQDAVATLNGQTVTGRGNQFSLIDGGVAVELTIDNGQVGPIEPFDVAGRQVGAPVGALDLDETALRRVGQIVTTLHTLATGGNQAGLSDNGAAATRLVANALVELDALEVQLQSSPTSRAVPAESADDALTRARLLSETFRALAVTNPRAAADLLTSTDDRDTDALTRLLFLRT